MSNNSQADAKDLDDQTVETEACSITCTTEPAVHFKDLVRVRLIPGKNKYTKDESTACWYSQKEFADIMKGVTKECSRMERGKVLKDKKYCSRGLERYLTFNYIARKQNSRKAIQSVLTEQNRQQCENQEYNDEAIARVYHNVSSSCEMWAIVIGMRDQKEAESYVDEDDDDEWEDSTSTRKSRKPRRKTIPSTASKGRTRARRRSIPVLQQVAVNARTA